MSNKEETNKDNLNSKIKKYYKIIIIKNNK